MSVTASIVVRCYNEELHLGRLLDGIANQTVKDVEIVVVDSGSTDATLAVVSRYPVKLVRVQPDEFSFGRSLNRGCEVATGEFIVIASAHVYPIFQDWLEQILAPFADPRVGLTYGRQTGTATSNYAERQVFERWFPPESNLNQDHPFCNNANAAIRKTLWEQVPYDELLTGLEDVAWARRAMEMGYRIAYMAGAEVVHVHNETLRAIYNRYRREAIAMKRIFPQERFSLLDFVRLFGANASSDCGHAWRDGSLLRNIDSILGFRLMQFWGTYRGFGERGAFTNELRRRLYYPRRSSGSRLGTTEAESRKRVEYASASPTRTPTAHRRPVL